MKLRIVFMGTPDFAAYVLRALHDHGHEIVAIYSQPPRPGGRRGLEPVPSPVHRLGDRLGIEVRTPVSLQDPAEHANFARFAADVAIVVAYGLILPQAILDAPRHGALNAHASALPRWRGAAPIQRAIMAGDTETAATIMRMDAGLDTGPVALSETLAIGPDETAGELHDRLAEASARLMLAALERLEQGELPATAQAAEGIAYAAKISKAETRIDWARPAPELHNHIRGLSPVPGAWCEMQIGDRQERVRILRSRIVEGTGQPGEKLGPELIIACGTGAIELLRLQKAGGKPLEAADFLRGAPVKAVS